MGECVRSGFCNFMHLKPISRELRRDLYGRNKPGGGRTRPRSRSRSRDRGRSVRQKIQIISSVYNFSLCSSFFRRDRDDRGNRDRGYGGGGGRHGRY